MASKASFASDEWKQLLESPMLADMSAFRSRHMGNVGEYVSVGRQRGCMPIRSRAWTGHN
jgi:hypothetical protein